MAFLFCVVHYSPSAIGILPLGSGSGGSGGVGLHGSFPANAVNEQNANIAANINIRNLFFIRPFCLH